MATKKLAKELGLVRKRSRPSDGNSAKQIGSRQFFSYLIVIDFESTCWKEKNSYGQEIIEFPAVLLNTFNGKIDSEFHTYVQPQEHPILSEFCTELTGISQTRVEAGVPLQICLSRFTRWLQMLQQEKNIVFVNEKVSVPTAHPCAFVTWSDWDLGVCLLYECRRKQICKPDVLNSWIDLRATYKLFYNRKPKGLNGALQDLGIEFSGREHSGLDDARNTAHLAWRMIRDGCLMKVTRTLDRAPLRTKPLFSNAQMKPELGNGGANGETGGGSRKRVQKQSKTGQHEKKCHSSENKGIHEVNSNSVCQYQSLVLPKTLLSCLTTPVQEKTLVPAPLCQFDSAGSPVAAPSSHSMVLVSTSVACTETFPVLDINCNSVNLDAEYEEAPFLVETESCSYDDVLLEDGETSAAAFTDTYPCVSQDSNSEQQNVEANPSNASSCHSNQIVFKSLNTTVYSLEKARPCHLNNGVFKTPLMTSRKPKDKNVSFSSVTSSTNLKEVTHGPNKSTCSGLYMTTPHSSFTIYEDKDASSTSKLSSGRSGSAPSLRPSSSMNRMSLPLKSSMKITSPLCSCGRRAKRLTVSNGGPNHGRVFYSCPIGKTASGNKKSCGFFKWESACLKSKSTPTASTSLCFVPEASIVSLSFSNKSLSIPSVTKFPLRPSLRN